MVEAYTRGSVPAPGIRTKVAVHPVFQPDRHVPTSTAARPRRYAQIVRRKAFLLMLLALAALAGTVIAASGFARPGSVFRHRAPAPLASTFTSKALPPLSQPPGICSAATGRCEEGCALPVAAARAPRAQPPKPCHAGAVPPCMELVARGTASPRAPFCARRPIVARVEGLPRLRR